MVTYIGEDWIAILITALIMLGTTIGLYFLLRNKSDKIKNIPLIVVTGLIVGLEITKQILGWTSFIDGTGGLFFLPFHICSMIIFAPFLASILKRGSKTWGIFFALALMVTIMSSISMYVAPRQIISGSASNIFRPGCNFFEYHTFFFHSLAAMFIMLVVAFKPYKPTFKDILYAGCIYIGYMVVSAIMANILDTNFARFLDFGGLGGFDVIRGPSGHDNLFWFALIVLIIYSIVMVICGLITYYSPKLYYLVFKKKQTKETKKDSVENKQ